MKFRAEIRRVNPMKA